MTVICRVVRSDARAAERPEPKLRFDPRRARTNSWRLYSFLLFFPTARHPYLFYRNSLDLGSRLHHHGLFNWIVKQQRTACEIAYVGMTDPTVRISRSTHVSGKLLIVASQIDVRLSYASAIRKIERNRCFSFRKTNHMAGNERVSTMAYVIPLRWGRYQGTFMRWTVSLPDESQCSYYGSPISRQRGKVMHPTLAGLQLAHIVESISVLTAKPLLSNTFHLELVLA